MLSFTNTKNGALDEMKLRPPRQPSSIYYRTYLRHYTHERGGIFFFFPGSERKI